MTLVPIKNAKIYQGMLTGGKPEKAHIKQFHDGGYKTVIDLRSAFELGVKDDRSYAQSLGLQHVSLEVSGGQGVTFERAEELHKLLAEAEGPVVLHCGSGNRVGALIALRAYKHLGLSRERALSEGRAAGMRSLESRVRELIDNAEAH